MAGETILLVDDDDFIHKLVGGYLRDAGYKVLSAWDGVEALRIVHESSPKLVVTDVRMPELNGLELTRRLRSHYKTSRLPIIMFSVLADAKSVLSGYAEGADEYLPKPFDLAVLGAKIESLLRRSSVAVASAGEPGSVVLVMHAKGGVGATTVAVNLAAMLSTELSASVAVLDLSLEFQGASTYLDLKPKKTLADLASLGGEQLDEEMFQHLVSVHAASKVSVVVGSDSPEKAELVTVPAVQIAIERLRAVNDWVMVDAPPSFTEKTLAALDAASQICLVTSPTVPALRATRECLNVFSMLKVPSSRVMLILNLTTIIGVSMQSLTTFLGRAPDYVITHSESFDHCANTGVPMVLSNAADAASRDYRALADVLTSSVKTRTRA